MKQESISSHFKNVKRKSALEAKEKISSINGLSSNKPAKQADDTLKPQKIVPESLNNLNRINLENSTLQPLKRRSTRNTNINSNLNNLNNNAINIGTSQEEAEVEFEIPQTLEKSKKLNLEETINKKRKREAESASNIKAAKALLLLKSGKNTNKKNGKSEINESLRDENIMEIDDLTTKNKKQKMLKNTKKNNAKDFETDRKLGLVNNDVSDKTKNLVKKIMENKNKQKANLNVKEDDYYNQEFGNFDLNSKNNNNISNLNNKARNDSSNNNNRNFSVDKNYISDDVLDTVEETLKSKKAKNLSKLGVEINNFNLALRERKNLNNSKAPNNNNNINNKCKNNANENSLSKSPVDNSFLSTNSTDLNNASLSNNTKIANRKNTKNESINNINNNISNNFESPTSYIFNKINNDFSFEDQSATAQEKETNQNPSKNNNNNNKDNSNNNNKNAKNNKNSNTEEAAANNKNTIIDKKGETAATQKSLLLPMEANKSKSKAPELSATTLKMLEELKENKRENNFKRPDIKLKERDRSQSSFSLKFKYEELVKDERELPLPTAYKKLFVKFTQLDQTLNFFKISKSNKVPSFPEIKRSIEITYKEDFEFEHFLKMLYIVPHFFVYSWEKLDNEEKDYKLLIGVPKKIEEKMNTNYLSDFDFVQMQKKYDPSCEPLSKEILEKRKTIFKNILLEIVNLHHKNFLKAIDFTRAFDPFKMKTWHSRFDLEKDAEEIPIFEIAEQPTIKIVKISDFLNNNDIKSDLIRKAMEQCEMDNAKEKEKEEAQGAASLPPLQANKNKEKNVLNSFISKDLLQKIKAKESAVKMHSEIIEYSTHKSKQKSRLIDLKDVVDRIKNIFIMYKYATIPMNELCEKIKSGSNSISCVDSIDVIKNIIYALKEYFPNLLFIKEHQIIGTVVRLDPNASIKDVLGAIEKKDLADKIFGF